MWFRSAIMMVDLVLCLAGNRTRLTHFASFRLWPWQMQSIVSIETLAHISCSSRQTRPGGLNGRPEKLPDVCYSWWILSGLVILRREAWLD